MKKFMIVLLPLLYGGFYIRFGNKKWLATDLVKLEDEYAKAAGIEVEVPDGLELTGDHSTYIEALVKENTIWQLRSKYNSYLKDLGKSIFLP